MASRYNQHKTSIKEIQYEYEMFKSNVMEPHREFCHTCHPFF